MTVVKIKTAEKKKLSSPNLYLTHISWSPHVVLCIVAHLSCSLEQCIEPLLMQYWSFDEYNGDSQG